MCTVDCRDPDEWRRDDAQERRVEEAQPLRKPATVEGDEVGDVEAGGEDGASAWNE